MKGKQIENNEKDIFTDKKTEENKSFKRDVTPMPNYYKNWEQFDVVS